MLTAGRERWNEDDCRLWDALRGPRLAVNLPGAEHLALSDAVWLVKGIVRTGDAKPDRAISAIRDYVASFLDANLSGAESESRTGGRLPAYAGATVATQSESLCLQQSAGQPSGR
jgi:hypothetical protein